MAQRPPRLRPSPAPRRTRLRTPRERASQLRRHSLRQLAGEDLPGSPARCNPVRRARRARHSTRPRIGKAVEPSKRLLFRSRHADGSDRRLRYVGQRLLAQDSLPHRARGAALVGAAVSDRAALARRRLPLHLPLRLSRRRDARARQPRRHRPFPVRARSGQSQERPQPAGVRSQGNLHRRRGRRFQRLAPQESGRAGRDIESQAGVRRIRRRVGPYKAEVPRDFRRRQPGRRDAYARPHRRARSQASAPIR